MGQTAASLGGPELAVGGASPHFKVWESMVAEGLPVFCLHNFLASLSSCIGLVPRSIGESEPLFNSQSAY